MKTVLPYIPLFLILLIYFLIKSIKKYRQAIGTSSTKKNIPDNWRKLDVDINQCEIRSREYFEEPSEKYPSRIQMLDSIVGRPAAKQHRVVSVVIYKHQFPDGETQTFKSEPIYEEETNLRYMIMRKEGLRLYVDPSDRTNYYFGI